MKIIKDIPSFVREALMKDEYSKRGKYSVTETLQPAKCAEMRSRYPGDQPPLDKVMASKVGSGFHYMLERRVQELKWEGGYETVAIEVECDFVFQGVNISGSADYLNGAILGDYKTAKTYKYIFGDFKDWIKQLSVYSYGLDQQGRKVSRAMIHVFFLDWMKSAYERKPSEYPPSPVMTLDFTADLLPFFAVEEHLKRFLHDREVMAGISDKELPDAPESDLWPSENCFKVYKDKKAVRAKRVFKVGDFESKEVAEKAATDFLEDGVVKYFSGELKRCEYCNVAERCYQYKNKV